MRAPTTIHVTAGPDSGSTFALGPGRWLVGRSASCAVRLDDPAVEAHHALLISAPDGLGVVQLAGRHPLLVDGDPIDAGQVPIAAHRSIEIGHDLMCVGAPPVTPSSRAVLGVDSTGGAVGFDVRRRPVDVIAVVIDPEIDPVHAMAGAVLRSLVAQVSAAGDRVVIVTGAADDVIAASGFDGEVGVTVVAVLPGDSPVLDRCTARLDLGSRWRGRWTASAHRPLSVERVHLRGAAASADAVGPFVVEQVARALSEVGSHVLRVPQPARLEGEAAAADALAELIAHAGERRDAGVELGAPCTGQPGPVAGVRRPAVGKRTERDANVAEAQADELGGTDEADAAEHIGAVPPVPGGRPLAVDQPFVLVEAKR